MTHIESPEVILEAARKYAQAVATIKRVHDHLTKNYRDQLRHIQVSNARMGWYLLAKTCLQKLSGTRRSSADPLIGGFRIILSVRPYPLLPFRSTNLLTC